MVMRCLEESAQRFDGLLEGLGELALFLIAPGTFQVLEAGVQAHQERFQFLVKSIEVVSKPPKFGRIYMGFGHTVILPPPVRQLPSFA